MIMTSQGVVEGRGGIVQFQHGGVGEIFSQGSRRQEKFVRGLHCHQVHGNRFYLNI